MKCRRNKLDSLFILFWCISVHTYLRACVRACVNVCTCFCVCVCVCVYASVGVLHTFLLSPAPVVMAIRLTLLANVDVAMITKKTRYIRHLTILTGPSKHWLAIMPLSLDTFMKTSHASVFIWLQCQQGQRMAKVIISRMGYVLIHLEILFLTSQCSRV